MHPVLFKLGPITIYTYGVFIFLGVLIGYFVSLREAVRKGIDKDRFTDLIFWTLIFSFLGARVFYVLVEFKTLIEDPWGIIFSRSGFVFHGGVISGIAAVYLLTKKYKIRFLKAIDSIAVGLPIGHSLGRLGCFFYGCCFGRPTNSFIGVLFPFDSAAGSLGVKVIPTQLISSVILFFIFIILIFLKKNNKFDGQIFLYYIFSYGIFRFIIEFFRGDYRGEIFIFSTAQFISMVLIAAAVFLFFKWRRI